MITADDHVKGGCACGDVRYQVMRDPFIVHGCHCRMCQRLSGGAFAINALVEAKKVKLLSGTPERVEMDTPSGKGQTILRCSRCKVAVWSHYYMGGIREGICFVRVGTLDNPDLMPPDVHIYTTTRQSWLTLPEDAHVVDIFYDFNSTWSAEDNAWRKAQLSRVRAVS